jgi:tRNA G18 (ribose-2'-O)-methylase SpoU
VCQIPECGLRYPLAVPSEFGERCPICLGSTTVVAHVPAQREDQVEPAGTEAGLQAVLDNVRSAWNVGSIFRTAEGFGFSQLYLCGITPTPENEQVRKTALGAEGRVGWSAHRNAVMLVEALKRHGQEVWVLERTDRSERIDYADRGGQGKRGLVLVVGNEQAGVDPGILELADRVVHIEMRGSKRSFNVAIAFALGAQVIGRMDTRK